MAESNMAAHGQYENESKFLSFLSIVMSNISNITEIATANTIEIFISSFGIILITKMAESNMDESNLAADGNN